MRSGLPGISIGVDVSFKQGNFYLPRATQSSTSPGFLLVMVTFFSRTAGNNTESAGYCCILTEMIPMRWL